MNYRQLDLNLLIALNALLQKRSVSAAAEMLNIGQPACSAALARLRDHFGDELLVSVSRRMVPTPLALQLEGPVREIIEQAELISLARPGFDPSMAKQRFLIVCSDLVTQVLLTQVIRKLQHIASNVSVVVRSTTVLRSSRMPVEEALERRGCDFIVLPERYLPNTFPHLTLFTTDYRCVAWKHNTQLGDTLSIDEFYRMKHVAATFSDGRVVSMESDDALGERRSRQFAIKSDSFISVPSILKGTNYLATLPTPFAQYSAQRHELKLFDVPFQLPNLKETLIWPKHLDDDPASRWFRELLKACAQGMGGSVSMHPEESPMSS